MFWQSLAIAAGACLLVMGLLVYSQMKPVQHQGHSKIRFARPLTSKMNLLAATTTTTTTAKPAGSLVKFGDTIWFETALKFKNARHPEFPTVLSNDGTVLAIGFSPNGFSFPDENCRVYVYHRYYSLNTADAEWVQTGYFTRAVPSNNILWGNVALSADGTVLAMRVRGTTTGSVMVYRFQSTNNKWVPLGSVSSPSRSDDFGYSMALSSDGSILAVSTSDDKRVDIFRWNGTAWRQRGSPIYHAKACSMSHDGNVVAAWDFYDRDISVFRFNASVKGGWLPMGSSIEGPDYYNFFDGGQGSNSVSGDGKRVAAFGYSNDDPSRSVLLVYEYNIQNNEWEPVGPGATHLDDEDNLDPYISLSNDGSLVAEVQGPEEDETGSYPGEVLVYKVTNNGAWPRFYSYYGPYIDSIRGRSVAISGDGNTLVVANFGFDTYQVLTNDNEFLTSTE